MGATSPYINTISTDKLIEKLFKCMFSVQTVNGQNLLKEKSLTKDRLNEIRELQKVIKERQNN